jgi:hypothetical protein
MRMPRGAAPVILAALVATTTAVATSTASAAAPDAVSWSPPLTGEAVGVVTTGGTAQLGPDRLHPDVQADGHGDAGAPGLLTLPAHRLDAPVDRVDAELSLAAGGPDAPVAVDVRGVSTDGRWTEWETAEPSSPSPSPTVSSTASSSTRTLTAVLPRPVVQVQARLVLGPVANGTDPGPAVRRLELTARPAIRATAGPKQGEPRRHRVFATREGLVGRKTANGHVITERDVFVALPSRRALASRFTAEYTVKVCASTGRCAFAPVWDVGPWNTRDDYWNPSERRQEWRDLPRGKPEAQAAKEDGFNGGKDQFGRTVRNPAGIDLADGLFWDALGLKDNAWVDVDYLWTGDSPLGTARVDGRVDLHAAPDPAAAVVGLVADSAAVPVQCVADGWLRVGSAQFVPASAVATEHSADRLPACSR